MTRALAYDTKGWFFFLKKKTSTVGTMTMTMAAMAMARRNDLPFGGRTAGRGLPPLVKRGVGPE